MRILYISPRQCWPPVSGGKLRDFHLARALGEQGTLTYAHYYDPGGSPMTRKELPFCHEVISLPKPRAYSPFLIARGLFGNRPLPILNYTSAEMNAALIAALRKDRYDLIHIDCIQLAGCLQPLSKAVGALPLVAYNWHNIESEAMRGYSKAAGPAIRRFYAAATANKLERWERMALKTGFGHVVCSEPDQRQLLEWEPAKRVAVIDNGVDTDYFSDGAPGPAAHRILFVGSMNYHPNIVGAVEFARRTWPELREKMPGLQLTIVGSSPDASVLALREVPGVEVTGTVPDVRPYYREAVAAIVPLRTGGGTRLKILEAMAAGVPVISSELGAQGLEVEPGRNILLAEPNDSQAWLRALAELSSDTRRRELTAAGARLVRERYDWTMLGRRLCEIYRRWLDKG